MGLTIEFLALVNENFLADFNMFGVGIGVKGAFTTWTGG